MRVHVIYCFIETRQGYQYHEVDMNSSPQPVVH